MKLIICEKPSQLTPEYVSSLVNQLPSWRREQALKFRHLNGQVDCALSYLLLCQLLREEYGIIDQPTFIYAENGKPSLAEFPDLYFSISHCKMAVGCLLSTRPCGLDIEYIRKAKEDLVRHTMSPQEVESIFSSRFPDIAFTRLWTQKEAVLKLKGTGIVDDLHSVLNPDRLQGIEIQTVENPYMGYVYTIAKQI